MNLNKYDFIVIGAGLSGSVVSRKLAEDGKKILIIESRSKVSGHIFDEVNEIGVLVQQYGPHIFHTNKEHVFEFITKYHEWFEYKLKCEVYMENKFTPSPFNFKTIDDYFSDSDASKIKRHISTEYPNLDKVSILELLNSNNSSIKKYADFLWEKDYKLYTSKQWGVDPSEIDKSVLRRVPVRLDYKDGYFDDKYQLLPKDGYYKFIENVLNHKNIDLILNTNALEVFSFDFKKNLIYLEDTVIKKPIIYTGPIDYLLKFKYGKLPYRSLRFDYKIVDKSSFQNSAITAYPQEKGYTRITEYTKLPYQNVGEKTVVAYEYPLQASVENEVDPYYPIPNDINQKQYESYLNDTKKIQNLHLCGRLADYKYYNMDDAIDNALNLYEKLKLM